MPTRLPDAARLMKGATRDHIRDDAIHLLIQAEKMLRRTGDEDAEDAVAEALDLLDYSY